MVRVDETDIGGHGESPFRKVAPLRPRCVPPQAALHRLGRRGPLQVRQDDRGVAVRDRQHRDLGQPRDLLRIETPRARDGGPARAQWIAFVRRVGQRAPHDRSGRTPGAPRVDRTLDETVLLRVGVQDRTGGAALLGAQDLAPLPFPEVAHQGNASLERNAIVLEGLEVAHRPLPDIDHLGLDGAGAAVGAERLVVGGVFGERIARDPVLDQRQARLERGGQLDRSRAGVRVVEEVRHNFGVEAGPVSLLLDVSRHAARALSAGPVRLAREHLVGAGDPCPVEKRGVLLLDQEPLIPGRGGVPEGKPAGLRLFRRRRGGSSHGSAGREQAQTNDGARLHGGGPTLL